MSFLDTQLEFFNFDLLSDDEVQKIRNLLKQPCTAVELPESYLCAVGEQGYDLHDYKSMIEMIPVEFSGAVTVGSHYSPHISQAQIYTMTTSVNGTSYISTGYPMTTNVYMTKDYHMPKMINGMEVGDVGATATVASTCDAVMDGLTACIANNPAGGVVVSPSMYAPWSGMYPCAQYVLPHVPTFFTPIAPVHPSAMRATGPSASVRADAYPSQAVPTPYVAVSAMPPVTATMAVPMSAVPTGMVAGPPQTVIVPSVMAEESAPAIICAKVEEPSNLEIVSTAMVTVNVADMYNGEPGHLQDADLQDYGAHYGDEHPEEVYDLEENAGIEMTEEDAQQNGVEYVPSDYEEQEKQVLPSVSESSVTTPNSWTTNKSWASLFKSSSPAAGKPSPVAPASVKVAQLAESPHEPPSVTAEQQSTVGQNTSPNNEPSPHIPETTKPVAMEKPKFPQSNGFMETNQDDLHHLGEALLDMQLDNRHVNFLPRGLSNKGNWCYINSTLQALLACPPFYNLLSKLPTIPGLKHGSSSTPIMDSMVEFVHEFLPTAPHKIQANINMRKKEDGANLNIGPQFEPVYIYEMLSRLRLNAFEGRQEDTEEFLSCLLNGLHEEMLAALNNVESKYNNGAAVATNGNLEEPLDDEEDEAWKVIEKRNKSSVTRTTDFQTSPVSDIFCGRIRSALHAVSKSSATLQPFFTLQLDIQSEDVRSVKEALQRLVIKESLQGYHCSKTKQEVAASRQITLEELPPILILHLKRFVYDKDGGGQKLSKKIDFSIDLDISKELLSPMVKAKLMVKQRSYKLIAVVYHCGGEAAKGHYVADVYHHGSSAWLRTDDSRVLPITEVKVLNHPANMVPYLLFYRRQDTIQFSAINKK